MALATKAEIEAKIRQAEKANEESARKASASTAKKLAEAKAAAQKKAQ